MEARETGGGVLAKTFSFQMSKSGDLMYSMQLLTAVNDTVLYI